MRVLVVGAGRMGLRHLRGLAAAGVEATVVDPRPEARSKAGAAAAFATLEEALGAGRYEAAVLAETAAGRLERFTAVAGAGISRVLVEKPLEQSRARTHSLAAVAHEHRMEVRVNHFFRTLHLFRELREGPRPFHLAVTGGAFGLACNGIHWIDLARFLSGDADGLLLYGELDEEPIGSGRGGEFRDYGGRALYGFPDGSRLYLASAATSSAPMHAVLEQPSAQAVLFPGEELALRYEREQVSQLPPYRYGGDYARRALPAFVADELWRSTERWARGDGAHPEVATSVRAHDLLFDLLETSGEREFQIT
jgi:predicted dehydrogenase